MTERINHLHQRLNALEARTAETGLMGRVIRRVEALEDKGNYGSTVVNHEARLKALEAAREPAHAPETVTVSKKVWDATQERVKNAINALYEIQALVHIEGARRIANEAIARDIEFEAVLFPAKPDEAQS